MEKKKIFKKIGKGIVSIATIGLINYGANQNQENNNTQNHMPIKKYVDSRFQKNDKELWEEYGFKSHEDYLNNIPTVDIDALSASNKGYEPLPENYIENIKYRNVFVEADKFINSIKLNKEIILKHLPKESLVQSNLIDLTKISPSRTHLLQLYAKKFKVNPKLLVAIAIAESNFGLNKNKSNKGAEGMFQIMPINKNAYAKGIEEPYANYITACKIILEIGKIFNIDVSSKNLFESEIAIIAASYNIGHGTLRKNPEFVFKKVKETKEYVIKIISSMKLFNFMLSDGIYFAKGNWESKNKIMI